MFETTNRIYIYITYIICYTTIIHTVASPDGGFPRERITQPSTGPSARYPPQGSTWRRPNSELHSWENVGRIYWDEWG